MTDRGTNQQHCLLNHGNPSGGTDIISCFAGAVADVPVYRGQLQARNLGMAISSWDECGERTFIVVFLCGHYISII